MAKHMEALQQVLANLYALTIKTQNYHWNVTGPHFPSLHLLFDTQYRDLAEALDIVAERIRACGVKTHAGLDVFAKRRTITDGRETATALEMVHDLAASHRILVEDLKKALAQANAAKDEATLDVLIERLRAHEKHIWMLDATGNH